MGGGDGAAPENEDAAAVAAADGPAALAGRAAAGREVTWLHFQVQCAALCCIPRSRVGELGVVRLSALQCAMLLECAASASVDQAIFDGFWTQGKVFGVLFLSFCPVLLTCTPRCLPTLASLPAIPAADGDVGPHNHARAAQAFKACACVGGDLLLHQRQCGGHQPPAGRSGDGGGIPSCKKI
jgi:hypothetical protein